MSIPFYPIWVLIWCHDARVAFEAAGEWLGGATGKPPPARASSVSIFVSCGVSLSCPSLLLSKLENEMCVLD